MDEIRALAGPVVQRHFEKVEAERQALQAKLEAERAKKAAAEAEARKAAEAEKAAAQQEGAPANGGGKDEEMTDADASPAKPEVEEAGDP
jgi:heat shock protein 4